MSKEWDAFISHATEDKDTIVSRLADALEKLKVKIWYDEFSLKVGDSLTKSIDEGLNKSRFGIIVISKKFLEKRWTDYEYRSLLSKEENNKVILPIWHDITREEVKGYSLYLADKVALNTSKMSVNKLALTLTEIIRPDIYRNIQAYLLFKKLTVDAKPVLAKLSDLKPPEHPQSKLSKQLEVRARIIYYGIGKAFNFSIEQDIFNYELDIRPDREIQTWAIMNLCYLELINKHKIEDFSTKRAIAYFLVGFIVGQVKEVQGISIDLQNELVELWKKYYYEY